MDIAAFCIFLSLIGSLNCAWDPYQVLGLHRGADTQDIRRAYKQYAKEWCVFK